MPIKIVQKTTKAEPVEEVLEGESLRALTKQLVPPEEIKPPEMPPCREAKEAIASWKAFPPPHAKPVECAYCHQFYIMPCTATQSQGCLNFEHLQRQTEKASVKSTQA